MGFISASGTGFAAPTAVSAILIWFGLAAAQAATELEVQVQ